MARNEHIDILKQGVIAWNAWRAKHPNEEINLREAYLNRAILREAYLNRADLSGAYLREAYLSKADLDRAKLRRAILRGAILSEADLSEADLSEANLSEAILNGAILNGAILNGTNLSEADLSEADLSGANLSGTNLSGTNLSGANLSGANLSGTNLSGTNLSGTNLNEATTSQTIFNNLDLRHVKGLETIQHLGPSGITTSTLERSEGDIPNLFLKGAGLSNVFIIYTRSLVQSPIQYYTCFLSYSSRDELFARRLHNDLQQEGIRCWFAPEDMDIGDKIRHRIEESIRLYDKLLLILSNHSIKSSWVAYEVEKALNKEPEETPNVLYPVRLDQTILTCTESWAQEIKKTRHIGNFEDWKDPEQYQESFKRLLRGLNAKKDQKKS